ncbi:MAG TPA: acyltransferase [Thermoanaerobaculia bacterium]|jgi:peptidoglycan/LPS O-acetylase OafA/YrhL
MQPVSPFRMLRTNNLPNRRVPELDGLRAVAILLVVAYHYLEPVHRTASGWRFVALAPARVGWIGVDLFFVLSGYLIASILLANREAPAFFSTFYIRRFCRILPLYLPVVAVFYFAHARFIATPQPPLLQYLTFTHNFWIAAAGEFGNWLLGVTWSLAVEEQFYLLLPALVRFNRPRRLLAIVIACICLAPLLRYAFLVTSNRDAFFPIQVLLPTRLDSLMLGVLAALLHWRGIAIPKSAVWSLWLLSGWWIVRLMMVRPAPGPIRYLFMAALSDLWIALFCVTTLLLALNGRFPFLRWRALTYTGLISYGLYLLHQPVKELVHRLLPGRGIGLNIVAFVVVFIAAALSWELFEKRFVRYGHRFLYDPAPANPHEQKSDI